MRVGIIALLQESNTFVFEPTEWRHFESHLLARGEAVRGQLADAAHEVGGFFQGLDEEGLQAIPLFAARALPYGTVTDATYAALKQALLGELASAGSLDGLLLAPHGATVSATIRDVDGDWISAVRQVVGPTIPLVVTADPHGNLSPKMVEAADAIIAYRTNPHLDQRERGLEAARLIARMLRGEVRPRMAAAFPPMVINIDRQCTDEMPCRALCEEIDKVRAEPGVLSASLFLGFPYADVVEMGTSIVVVTDDDLPSARRHATQLAADLWEKRHDFRPDLLEPAEAIDRALALAGPVCCLDMGDNVGGGSAADGTVLARHFHERELGPTFVCLYDPVAVQQAEQAGVGQPVAMAVGGKTDHLHGAPLEGIFMVEDLRDGVFHEPQARHAGMTHFDQGRTAIVRAGSGLVVMLTSRRMVPFSLHQLTDLGIKPEQFRFLIAKGVNAPLAAYSEVCPSFVRVNTPGATTADLSRLAYTHRRRPLFPFDPETAWQAGTGTL